MEVISRTVESLYQTNDEQVVMFDKVYPKHTLVLTEKVVTEFKDYFQTTMTFTITSGKE